MSVTTSPESLIILINYLRNKFYTPLTCSIPNVSVLYNTITTDLLTLVPVEFKDSIDQVKLFSDYVALVSEATNKFEFEQDKAIGIIYIDPSATDDVIIIANMPGLKKVKLGNRKSFLATSNLNTYQHPFWFMGQQKKELTTSRPIQNNTEIPQTSSPPHQESPSIQPDSPETVEKGKKMLETAITNYCVKNNIPRDNILDVNSFLDHLLPDIFKFKITVSDEQQIHEEVKVLDTSYPEVFLKSLAKMGYLE